MPHSLEANSEGRRMDVSGPRPHPYENTFLLLLLLLAGIGLVWLFRPFMPGLFLAALLAASTYPLFLRLQRRFGLTRERTALAMCVLVVFGVLTPVMYLLTATGARLVQGLNLARSWLSEHSAHGGLQQSAQDLLERLALPEGTRELLLGQLTEHQGDLGNALAQMTLALVRGISGHSLAFFSALILIAFTLFFLYRDGPALLQRLALLTPLANDHDRFLWNRFSSLATALTLSTLFIALLQGASFSVVTLLLGLPGFYLGMALAMTSFVPVVGGALVWGPVAWYLAAQQRLGAALLVMLWGAVVVGFIFDNLLRPFIIRRLAPMTGATSDLGALNHTLITVLANIGGLIHFGIPGLLFGPVMAAMAIAVFDLYENTHRHLLDGS
ncbi:MAG: AI-2E family transporter [Magnetococcus sp. WYHC-3]